MGGNPLTLVGTELKPGDRMPDVALVDNDLKVVNLASFAGKVLVIFFPIMAFVALGYEHCVANMYFIPMGLLLKGTAAAGGPAGAALESLTWGRFLTANLIPVTLGNVVGGAIFVGATYWLVYMRGQSKNA